MKLRLALVLLVTLICLVAALWGVDLAQSLAALQSADWGRYLPVFLCYFCAHSIRAWRLGLLIGHDLPYRRLFIINTLGFLAINVIPLRLGEALRPYLLVERERVPLGRALAGIVLERMLDMSMLLIMLLGLSFAVDLPAEGVLVEFRGAQVDVVGAGQRLAGSLLALGVLGAGVLIGVGEPIIRRIERLPLGPKVAGLARRFREGFLELLRQPLRGLLGLGASLAIWAITVVAVGLALSAFPGLPTGFGPAWSTWAITISGMTALPTPGFFGAYELFNTAALRLWGVDRDLATTFALVLHLGQFGFIVLLGGICLALEGLSLRDLVVHAGPEERRG